MVTDPQTMNLVEDLKSLARTATKRLEVVVDEVVSLRQEIETVRMVNAAMFGAEQRWVVRYNNLEKELRDERDAKVQLAKSLEREAALRKALEWYAHNSEYTDVAVGALETDQVESA